MHLFFPKAQSGSGAQSGSCSMDTGGFFLGRKATGARSWLFTYSMKLKYEWNFFYLNINQLYALNFMMGLFHASTCFEPMCHRQEVKIVLYSLWYHHTYRWPSGSQVERECNFDLLTMSTCARNI